MFFKVQEAHRTPNRTRTETPHNTRLNQNTKCTKQRKAVETLREETQVTFKGKPIRIISGFHGDF